jgi:nucleoside-diphosphate-sugar epimerase
MKSILITGNMGYIGPVWPSTSAPIALTRRLPASTPASSLANLLDTSMLPECLFDVQRFADVRNVTAADLAGVDAVVHLAAISNDPMGNAYERVTEDINFEGTMNVARAARKPASSTSSSLPHAVCMASPKMGRGMKSPP